MPIRAPRLARAMASGSPTWPQPPMTTASSSYPPWVTGAVLPWAWLNIPAEYFPVRPAAAMRQYRYARDAEGRASRSNTGDELLDPLVDRPERVLAQHGALGLVVELQVNPVHGEVAAPLLRPADELAAQPSPGGLRRDRLGLEDVQVPSGPVDRAVALEQVV